MHDHGDAVIRHTELRRIPSIPESDLPEDVVDRLPQDAPAAPWSCRAQAVVWVGRPVRDMAAAPDGRRPVAVAGGMFRYLDTPVGAYDEVFGAIGFLDRRVLRGHVRFMAVDSESSLLGGRANWALPKTLASFSGDPLADSGMTARGDWWQVGARAKAYGPALPIRTRLSIVQVWPDGVERRAPMSLRGRGRLAAVSVDVEAAPTLAGLLAPGRHPGVVLERATLDLGAPR